MTKELSYYKGLVDKNCVSLKELGHEFKIWRKEYSRLVKLFEDFCPEGCLATHKSTKPAAQCGKKSMLKGTQKPKVQPQESPKVQTEKNKKNTRKGGLAKAQEAGNHAQKPQEKVKEVDGKREVPHKGPQKGSKRPNGPVQAKPRQDVSNKPGVQKIGPQGNKPVKKGKSEWTEVTRRQGKNNKGNNFWVPRSQGEDSNKPLPQTDPIRAIN